MKDEENPNQTGVSDIADIETMLKMASGTDYGRILQLFYLGVFRNVDQRDVPAGAEIIGKATRLDMAIETCIEELVDEIAKIRSKNPESLFIPDAYLNEVMILAFRIDALKRMQYGMLRTKFSYLDGPDSLPMYCFAGDYEIFRRDMNEGSPSGSSRSQMCGFVMPAGIVPIGIKVGVGDEIIKIILEEIFSKKTINEF